MILRKQLKNLRTCWQDLDLDKTITTFHSLQVYLVVYLVSFIVGLTLQVGDRSVRLGNLYKRFFSVC